MPIALRILAVREETLWYHQMQIVLGAGHRQSEHAAYRVPRPDEARDVAVVSVVPKEWQPTRAHAPFSILSRIFRLDSRCDISWDLKLGQ